MNWIERLNRQSGKLPLDGGHIEVLYWAYAPHLADNLPHRHTFFEVCLVGERGQGIFRVQNREYPLGPGDLFIARPGIVHQIVNTARPLMELYWVCFGWLPTRTDTETARLMQAFADSPALVVPGEEAGVVRLWQALRDASDAPARLGQSAQIQTVTTALLLAVAQASIDRNLSPASEEGWADPAERIARAAVRYIQDNLNRPLSLPEIAAQVYVSPRHLSRLFSRFLDVSPAFYITRARMDRASGLLLRSDDPIKEVAASVGYADVHYFTRLFTRWFGRPPGAYRQEGGVSHVPKIQKPGALV